MTMNNLDRWASCRPIIEPNWMKHTEYRAYSEKTRRTSMVPDIKDVMFNPPATIVLWADGTKTVVKCQEDDAFDPNTGLAHAISKKALGDSYKKEFKKWTAKYNITRPLVLTDEVLEKLRANLLARLKGE